MKPRHFTSALTQQSCLAATTVLMPAFVPRRENLYCGDVVILVSVEKASAPTLQCRLRLQVANPLHSLAQRHLSPTAKKAVERRMVLFVLQLRVRKRECRRL